MPNLTPDQYLDTAPDCEALLALVPEYAFGLATDEETRRIEAELPGCPDAARALADYQQIQGQLRATVPQIEPPAGAEARLIARLTPATNAVLPSRAQRSARTAPLHRAWYAVAAALLALLLTNAYWLVRIDRVVVSPDGTAIAGSVFAADNTKNVRWVRLPASQKTVNGAALMMWNAESQTGILCVWGLPRPDAGNIYQFWLTRGPEFAAGGKVSVDDNGLGVLVFRVTEPIDRFTWANITLEPEAGSPAPTGVRVVNGKLPI